MKEEILILACISQDLNSGKSLSQDKDDFDPKRRIHQEDRGELFIASSSAIKICGGELVVAQWVANV